MALFAHLYEKNSSALLSAGDSSYGYSFILLTCSWLLLLFSTFAFTPTYTGMDQAFYGPLAGASVGQQ